MIRAIFLDLDGTVYRGSEACPDAADSIAEFIRRGFAVRYITNNSGARPESVHAKLVRMGVPSQPDWVVTSGMVAAKEIAHSFQKVGVVGNPGLMESMIEAGLTIVPFCDAEAVVVGLCFEFDFKMLQEASDAIRNGAVFYATNLDKTYPYDGGQFAPGAGSLIAAVVAASGVEPIVVGKPQPTMAWQACDELGVEPREVLFVGDRIETDLDCAQAAGCLPWLVLTGVSSEIPDGVLGSETLAGVLDYLENS
jgi:4-nitrophenyl phosphatase